MITLYELHWSHFCEKIRLALNYMGLPWQMVGIDAFKKAQLRQHPLPPHLKGYTVPAIHDAHTNQFVMDSTPILRYLAAQYPQVPQLFPGDPANRDAIDAQIIEFDTLIGLPARRFGYTQVILECPSLLPELFLSQRAGGVFTAPLLRYLAGNFLGLMLSKRFDFHRSEALGLYEALEQYLVTLAEKMEGREFVVGTEFSAADLSLAAHMRPITVVPFFAEHPKLQGLFERHRQITARWNGEGDFKYQTAIAQARLRKPPVRRKLRDISAAMPFKPSGNLAANDQKTVWTWGMISMPYHYWIGLRRRKVRQLYASVGVR
jgi:glutathione S-transferase